LPSVVIIHATRERTAPVHASTTRMLTLSRVVAPRADRR
jgi:hypothetical protein